MKQHVVAILKAIFIIILKEKRSPFLSIRSHLSKRSSEKIVRFGTEVSTECVPEKE